LSSAARTLHKVDEHSVLLACIVESRDGGATLCLAQTLYTEVDEKGTQRKKTKTVYDIFIISFLLPIAFPYKRKRQGTTMRVGMRHNIMRTRTSDKRQVQAKNAELAKRVEGNAINTINMFISYVLAGGALVVLSVSVSVKRVSQ